MPEFHHLQEAIRRQISDYDPYEGGEIEQMRKHIDDLQESVATLGAILVSHLNLDIEDLEDRLPNSWGASISKELTKLNPKQ